MSIYYFSHILIGLALCMLLVVFTCEGGLVAWFLGTDDKKETIQFIAYGMGGVVAAIVASAINRRADEQARNNKLIEKGHNNDRFQHAAANLGHEKRRVRITSFYQFYYLAEGSKDDFRKSIFDILCAHLRHITSGGFYKKEEGGAPTDECQALLNILFKPKDTFVFSKFSANLQKIHLEKMNLSDANLSRAILLDTNLSEADLSGADLSGADLSGANLSRAILLYANLSRTTLFDTDLSGAYLSDANISNAYLIGTNLSNAKFSEEGFIRSGHLNADLSGSNFSHANLSGTNFMGVQLKDAELQNVYSIEKANFLDAKIGDRNITPEDLPTDKGKYIAAWTTPEFWAEVEKNEKS